jgi:alpha-tubulin suppressor-like RCC1 family protein
MRYARVCGAALALLAGLLLAGLLLAACGDTTVNNASSGGFAPTRNDLDGDGLSNKDEINIWGTSPYLADTDGDGLTDYEEVIGFGFDPSGNNYLFNPLIADVPKIGVRITTTPSLAVNATATTGAESSYSVERSSTFSQSQTSSQSSTASTAVEITNSVSASLGFSGWSLSGSVSYDYSKTTSKEQSFTWSDEQSTENSVGYDNAQTEATNNSETLSGGSISVAVDIVNEGNLGFTVNNVIVGAVMLDPVSAAVLAPVGNLNLDTSFSSFPQFSLGPGERSSNLTFTNGGLDLATITTLLRNSTGLNVGVSAYEITDERGRAFAHNLTAIGAKTATVLIDYAGVGAREQERYLVATKADHDTLRVTAGQVLQSILRVPYATDPVEGGLTRVRNVVADNAVNSAWLVLHRSVDGVDPVTVIYDPYEGPYDFENLQLKAGDVLHLVFVIDEDGDGLRSRQETAFGSDPKNADTDGDGVDDGEEILWGLRPTVVQTVPGIPDGRRVAAYFSTRTNSGMIQTRDGKVLVRGDNTCGMGGTGSNSPVTLPTPSTDPAVEVNATWAVIAPGNAGTFAVGLDGTLHFWGCNYYGMAGVGVESVLDDFNLEIVSTANTVGSDQDWVNVWNRREFAAYALKSNGSLYAWGRHDFGQLGIGSATLVACPDKRGKGASVCRTYPTQVPGNWKDLSVGWHHVLAFANDGSLWGWGRNNKGQLGVPLGSLPDCGGECTLSPIKLANAGVYSIVSAGGDHSLAIRPDGSLWAWGNNAGTVSSHGGTLGLGDPDIVYKDVPTHVGSDLWADVAAGDFHSVGIHRDGTLWVWGFGASGRFGDGIESGHKSYSPVQVGTNSNWDRIWATEAATIARTTIPYRLVAFGINSSGYLSAQGVGCTAGNCLLVPTQIFPLPAAP